jgi:phage/plasmid-like protein (TIGR03299 family)
VWLLAKLNASFYVVDNDKVETYVLLASSHDRSLRIVAKPTSIRVVCANTLATALSGGVSMAVRHTASASLEIQMAHRVLGLATRDMEQMRDITRQLLRRKLNVKKFKSYVNHVFPTKKDENDHYDKLAQLFTSSPGVLPGMAGTGWAAFNAVTEYIDYVMETKSDRLYRSWFGSGAQTRQRAIKHLLS